MARIGGLPTIELHVSIVLTEPEARALDALACYGPDEFVKAFYEKLGKVYMEPHEAGLRLFLRSVREFMPGVLRRADDARKAFDEGLRT